VPCRSKARRYRERRADLDEALDAGDVETVRRVHEAVAGESVRLSDLYGLDRAGEAVEHAVPHAAAATLGDIGASVSLVHVVLKYLLPVQGLREVHRRLFRPDLAFLADIRRTSQEMTNAMPAIRRLWGLRNELVVEELADRFASLGQLSEVH
jgi:hypothetical protein